MNSSTSAKQHLPYQQPHDIDSLRRRHIDELRAAHLRAKANAECYDADSAGAPRGSAECLAFAALAAEQRQFARELRRKLQSIGGEPMVRWPPMPELARGGRA